MFKITKHEKPGKCRAYACKNPRAGRSKLCHKHKRRREKERDPVGYAFRVTRQNAKRRGKTWEITRAEWKEFCERTGYLDKKGRTAGAASLDRVDGHRGYSIDNIRILSLSENGHKGATTDRCPF